MENMCHDSAFVTETGRWAERSGVRNQAWSKSICFPQIIQTGSEAYTASHSANISDG
jgi:hypothetical protein